MYHPTTRVLTILELLQARPGLSGAAIARELEVDRRTVRRYIVMLQDLGIPIEAARGPHGGYRLRPGYRLPPLMLADDEALAVTLSLVAAQRQGLSVEPAATAGALAKIERVLPEALRERVQAVRAAVTFAAAPERPRPDGAALMQLSLAIQRGERVLLRHAAAGGETERRVDPYGLVFHWGRWYLAAHCHLRQAARVFRMDRVRAIEPLGELFTRPPGVDALALVMESLSLAPWGMQVEVLVGAPPEVVAEMIPPGWGFVEPAPGGALLRGQYDNLDWVAAQLLRFECPVTLLRPPELADAVRRLGERALALAAQPVGENVECRT